MRFLPTPDKTKPTKAPSRGFGRGRVPGVVDVTREDARLWGRLGAVVRRSGRGANKETSWMYEKAQVLVTGWVGGFILDSTQGR